MNVDRGFVNENSAAAASGRRRRRGIAEAVDRKIEALTDDFVTGIAAAGNPINLRRAEHRHEHLDEIEAALK